MRSRLPQHAAPGLLAQLLAPQPVPNRHTSWYEQAMNSIAADESGIYARLLRGER